MSSHLDEELRKVKEQILTMGGLVEKAIEEATQALILRKPEKFDNVDEYEKLINLAHVQIDEACIQLIAKEAPFAKDLRLLIALIKINTDLERMGDQAINISHNGKRYLSEPALKPLIDLPRMADEVRRMVGDSLDALVRQDLELAKKVLDQDDIVDSYKNQIFRELVTYMIGDPKTIERALNLILIARNLERLGDHATNIAEDVIYYVSGRDIRHHQLIEEVHKKNEQK